MKSDLNETAFIEYLATKLGRPTPTGSPPLPIIHLPEFTLTTLEAQISTFLTNWEALGGKGAQANSPEEAAQQLQAWLSADARALTNPLAVIGWYNLPGFASATLENLDWQMTAYSKTLNLSMIAEHTRLGITGADWGIAQSGTIVTVEGQNRGRVVSLLPPKHLTFLPITSLRDNLGQVMAELFDNGPSPAIEFITGPSRSADIEMDLSIGVHGPKEVFALLYPSD